MFLGQEGCCWPGQQSAVWGLGYAQTVCGDSFDGAVAATGQELVGKSERNEVHFVSFRNTGASEK